MPPSAIIDADIDAVDPSLYYALEIDSLWKTENLDAAGAATWSEALTPTIVNALLLLTYNETYAAVTFLRVRAAPSTAKLVLVMLVAQDTVGAATGDVYVARSANAGNSWTIALVGETALNISDFIVEYEPITATESGADKLTSRVCTRHDDGDDVNPWAIVYYTADRYSNAADDRIGFTFGGFDADDFSELMGAPAYSSEDYRYNMNGLLTVGERTTLLAFLVSEFSASYDSGTPNYQLDAARVTAWIKSTISANNVPYTVKLYTVWRAPNNLNPNENARALDISRTNSSWVYIGVNDAIWRSTDGGYNWTKILDTEGAVDICIDPQLAGVIYYWNTDGDLCCLIGGTAKETILSGSAVNYSPFRVARALSTGALICIDGTTLKIRDLGAWANVATDVDDGRGLRAYNGSYPIYIYLDASKIWHIDASDMTPLDITGTWAGYGNPRVIHLMRDYT